MLVLGTQYTSININISAFICGKSTYKVAKFTAYEASCPQVSRKFTDFLFIYLFFWGGVGGDLPGLPLVNEFLVNKNLVNFGKSRPKYKL